MRRFPSHFLRLSYSFLHSSGVGFEMAYTEFAGVLVRHYPVEFILVLTTSVPCLGRSVISFSRLFLFYCDLCFMEDGSPESD